MDIIGVARCGRAGRNEGTCESAVITIGATTSFPEYLDQIPFSHHDIYDRLLFLPVLCFLNNCTRELIFFTQTHGSLQYTDIQNVL